MTTWRDDVAVIGKLDHPLGKALRQVGQPADISRMIPTHKIALIEWVIRDVIPPALVAFVEAELVSGRLCDPEEVARAAAVARAEADARVAAVSSLSAGTGTRIATALAEVERLEGLADDLEMLLDAAEEALREDCDGEHGRLAEVVRRLRAEPRT